MDKIFSRFPGRNRNMQLDSEAEKRRFALMFNPILLHTHRVFITLAIECISWIFVTWICPNFAAFQRIAIFAFYYYYYFILLISKMINGCIFEQKRCQTHVYHFSTHKKEIEKNAFTSSIVNCRFQLLVYETVAQSRFI